MQGILITITSRSISHTILALSIFSFSSNSAICAQEYHSSLLTPNTRAKGSKRVNTPLASVIVARTCSIEKSSIAFMSSMRAWHCLRISVSFFSESVLSWSTLCGSRATSDFKEPSVEHNNVVNLLKGFSNLAWVFVASSIDFAAARSRTLLTSFKRAASCFRRAVSAVIAFLAACAASLSSSRFRFLSRSSSS